MRSVRPAAAICCLSPSTKGRLSTVVSPITTAEKSGYCGNSRHIASTNRSLPFCRRTRPNVPIPYFPGRPVSAKAASAIVGRAVEIDVDAVKDHSRRAPQKLRRDLARRDHRIHSADEEVGEPGFLALGGRIEDQRKAVAEQVQEQVRRAFRHCGARARCGPCHAPADGSADAQGRQGSRPRYPPADRAHTTPRATAWRSGARLCG